MNRKSEPSFLGIPKRDWMPILLYMVLCGILFYAFALLLSNPWNILAYTWIVFGQGMLINMKAIAKAYPRTVGGSVASFWMAAAWPYYCYRK